MKIGVAFHATDKAMNPVEIAREAEARGFHSLYIPEHTHIPTSRRTPPPSGTEVLGEEGLGRAVMVVATSDRPPIERLTAPFTAVTIAESFRDQGKNVLLLMDSVTRYAAASREVGLAVGERAVSLQRKGSGR